MTGSSIFGSAGFGGDGFPGADHWTGHAVYLPFGMALTPEDGDRIGRAVLADPRQP